VAPVLPEAMVYKNYEVKIQDAKLLAMNSSHVSPLPLMLLAAPHGSRTIMVSSCYGPREEKKEAIIHEV